MKKLSFLDRYLTILIFIAIFIGVLIGHLFPQVEHGLSQLSIGTTSIPIAIGLIVMMTPPLTKVKYEHLWKAFKNIRRLTLSFILNWLIAPFVMFFLALLFFHDQPAYAIGLIAIGVAPCIAMVILWNDMAEGDSEYCAALVAMNSLFQVFFYALYLFFLVTVMPHFFGVDFATTIELSMLDVAKSVFIYLGIPFILGITLHFGLRKWKKDVWFEHTFIPKFGKVALVALLYTIVLMFAFQGQRLIENPWSVVEVGIPLTLYFMIMFFLAFVMAKLRGLDYKSVVTIAFTAGSNNFELAIAVCVGLFGIASHQAFTAVIGPLIEVPIMIFLVKAALHFKKKYFNS